MVTSGSELQLRSVLMSKALVTIGGHGDVCELVAMGTSAVWGHVGGPGAVLI